MSHLRNLKRKRPNQPEEITFDFSARQDYLTGFHKRKLERAKHAQDIAIKKEKAIRLESRRQLRAERKAEIERHVKSVGELIAKAEDEIWPDTGENSDSDAEDVPIPEVQPLDHEENYSDDDRFTTVHIEEVDITRRGFEKIDQGEDENDDAEQHSNATGRIQAEDKDNPSKKRRWSKAAPKRDKTKKKKVRYETKTERKITRSKERSGGAKAKAKRKGR